MAKNTQIETSFWKRFTHNWSWYDSAISGVLMLTVGYMVGWAASSHQSLQATSEQLEYVLKMWAVFMMTGRGWSIARYPRTDDYKLKDLAWRHIFALHYVALFHFLIAVGFAYSLAPEIGNVINIFRSVPVPK